VTPGRLFGVAIAAVALALATVAGADSRPAYAHANLEASTPAANTVVTSAPAEIALRFNERVAERLTDVRVLDIFGDRVDAGDARVSVGDPTVVTVRLRPLPDGSYTVAWRTVSAVDGHPSAGSFIFSVGFPTITTPPRAEVGSVLTSSVEPWARWAAFAGMLGLAGGLLFRLVFDRVASGTARRGEDVPEGAAEAESAVLISSTRARSDAALWLVFATAIAGTVAQGAVAASNSYQIGLGSAATADILRLVQDSAWGRIWMARLALLALAALPLALSCRRESRRPDRSWYPTLLRCAALVLATGAVATLTLVSHGAATRDVSGLTTASDILHTVAAAIWVGGLVQLAVVATPLAGRPSSQTGARLLHELVSHFSLLAGLSAGVLLVTGLFSAYAQVTALDAALTPYGFALIAKVLAIFPLVALAATNLLWLRPRLRTDARARSWLARLVVAEAAVAAIVLLSVGFLTALEPARQVRTRELSTAAGIDFADRADGARIIASLQPGIIGDNSIVVRLEDRGGRPIENATMVSGRMRYVDQDLDEDLLAGLDHGGGTWVVHGVTVSITGAWQLEVVVQRPDAFDANLSWRLEIGAQAVQTAALAPDPNTAKTLFGLQIALIGLLFAGAAVTVGGFGSARGRVLSATGAAAVVAGGLFVAGSGISLGDRSQGNPLSADQASIESGRATYMANCADCHGESGAGNGRLRAGLPTAPANLTVHVPLHGDRELFRFVRDGLRTMPAWGGRLSDDDIWHVVNYMRTLTTVADR
jgi:copper transport protein